MARRNKGYASAFKRLFTWNGQKSDSSAGRVKGLLMLRRKFAVLGLTGALLVTGVSSWLIGTGSTQAAGTTNSTFIIPSNDGYGIGDCAVSGSTCGKVVADAWCEAQGFARSESFGAADAADTTGTIVNAPVNRPISITCGD